jgi:hypothetical protein
LTILQPDQDRLGAKVVVPCLVRDQVKSGNSSGLCPG